MKIEMGKKYRTRDGRKVRVLCTDRRHNEYPVVALVTSFCGTTETLDTFTSNGFEVTTESESNYDLIEVTPYDDFKIDEPVMVRYNDYSEWERYHFAKVTSDGLPMTFAKGCTSWTQNTSYGLTPWAECRRPTKEELGEQ